ncbi:MAG: aminopeptidase P family N-terminal domain-containing protein, partial [Janthinobacterium lividum]
MINTIDKVMRLRGLIAAAGLDGVIVPRADEHLGEYVPPGAERLAWLTGFTGSAGLAAVLAETAAVFTDGRYVLQLAAQTDPSVFEPRHIIEQPPAAWLKVNSPAGARIGYDPRVISADALDRYQDAGLSMVPTATNLVDDAWTDRPPAPRAPALPHKLAVAGTPSAEKRASLAADLAEAGEDAAVLTDPASIAWLLNIRGGDLAYTPFALGFALLHRDASVQLFMDPGKLGPETRAWLGNGVAVAAPDALEAALAALGGRRVRVDRTTAPIWFEQRLQAAGAVVRDGPDPCALPKARKNAVEQDGTRHAHQRDAVAVCRFLHWL